MNIVIFGSRKVGAFLSTLLSGEGYDVTVIDTNAKALERLSAESDIATCLTDQPGWKGLLELAESGVDLFIAASLSDEENLVLCSIAKHLGYPRTVCLIQEHAYLRSQRLDMAQMFHVDSFLGAHLIAAEDLLRTLLHEGDLAAAHFAHGAIHMRSILLPEEWKKSEVSIADLKLPDDLMIGLIRRKESDEVLFPHGDDHLLPEDEVTFVGRPKAIHHLPKMFQVEEKGLSSAILVGGSSVGKHLASLLLERGVAVRVIEVDPVKCNELAELLPEATIINRDGKNMELLQNEHVGDCGALVACTSHDETNLLIASFAKEAGCERPFALISDHTLSPLLQKLGVIPALSSNMTLGNRILSLLHEETIQSIGSLASDKAKIVEVRVADTSPLIGIPLSDLKHRLPNDLLIACIASKGKAVVGKGSRILSANDTVILLCSPERIPTLHELFE